MPTWLLFTFVIYLVYVVSNSKGEGIEDRGSTPKRKTKRGFVSFHVQMKLGVV